MGNNRVQKVTKGWRRVQGYGFLWVTMGKQEVTEGYKGLGEVTRVYKVSQKFVPLLYKSAFQYAWTW